MVKAITGRGPAVRATVLNFVEAYKAAHPGATAAQLVDAAAGLFRP